MKKLTKQDAYDILYGCTILGTGGGGSLQDGLKKMDEVFAQGKEITLCDFDELEPDDMIVCPYSCGAVSPESKADDAKYGSLPKAAEEPHVIALKQMEKYLGKSVKAVISTELGGGNTAMALYCAAVCDKKLVDGDPAGRSVPGLQHTTFLIHGLGIEPMSLCNNYGETVMITHVDNDYRAEEMVRSLAVISRNSIAVADHPAPAKQMKNAVIRGAITNAWKIGTAFRKALESGAKDVIAQSAAAGKGKIVFSGTTTAEQWDTIEGYTIGTVEIKSGNDIYKVWYKNENIISWKNGKYFVTVPDLLCLFDTDTQKPIVNPYHQVGQNVTAVVYPAPYDWTTPMGIELFGPRSFGYDTDWTPYNKLNK